MKQEIFAKAKELEERIKHLNTIIEMLTANSASFRCEPPTRQSGFSISYHDNIYVALTEAETLCLKCALEDEQARLIQEFNDL